MKNTEKNGLVKGFKIALLAVGAITIVYGFVNLIWPFMFSSLSFPFLFIDAIICWLGGGLLILVAVKFLK